MIASDKKITSIDEGLMWNSYTSRSWQSRYFSQFQTCSLAFDDTSRSTSGTNKSRFCHEFFPYSRTKIDIPRMENYPDVTLSNTLSTICSGETSLQKQGISCFQYLLELLSVSCAIGIDRCTSHSTSRTNISIEIVPFSRWPNKQFGWDAMNRTIQLFDGAFSTNWNLNDRSLNKWIMFKGSRNIVQHDHFYLGMMCVSDCVMRVMRPRREIELTIKGSETIRNWMLLPSSPSRKVTLGTLNC